MSNIDQHIDSDQQHEYMSAEEAATSLGVKVPTLYAYTSRGLVRSFAGPKGRARRYLRADIERLRARRDARAGHGPVAAGALRFGEPVLDTRITSIDADQGPSYRGRLATELAERDLPFETVCEFLWGGPLDEAVEPSWQESPLVFEAASLDALARQLPRSASPPERLSLILPFLAVNDPGRFTTRDETVLPRARGLMRCMTFAFVSKWQEDTLDELLAAPSYAVLLARAFALPESAAAPASLRALDRALVLCADHELNASTFAARIAASTGADLYACVGAALATLSGPRHGGAADRIEALIDEVARPERAQRVVHERARRGDAIEGFGHPLYPKGDPRGAALLALAEELAPEDLSVRISRQLVEAMHGSGGTLSVDLGLVALCEALGLARGSAAGLFAVARCAGWVAHCLEQYEAGFLLRPRARYLERD